MFVQWMKPIYFDTALSLCKTEDLRQRAAIEMSSRHTEAKDAPLVFCIH